MGKLIEVNKLNECLFMHEGKICPNRDIDNFPIMITVEDVRSAIIKQPTAYDVDKVVEQLEDYANEEMHYYKGTPYEKCIEVCIGKAIEIVKGGGVDAN